MGPGRACLHIRLTGTSLTATEFRHPREGRSSQAARPPEGRAAQMRETRRHINWLTLPLSDVGGAGESSEWYHHLQGCSCPDPFLLSEVVWNVLCPTVRTQAAVSG